MLQLLSSRYDMTVCLRGDVTCTLNHIRILKRLYCICIVLYNIRFKQVTELAVAVAVTAAVLVVVQIALVHCHLIVTMMGLSCHEL
jgi:hypothetical protein